MLFGIVASFQTARLPVVAIYLGIVLQDAQDQDLSIKIGQRIRDRRKQMGMSQAALADRVDLAQQAIYKIEHGYSTPGIHRLAALATALDLSLGELVDPAKTTRKSPVVAAESLAAIEIELIAVFRLLPDVQAKRVLLQVARRMCNTAPMGQSSLPSKP
jgi:transcriptional regulator with XRE-family HTH domain